MFRLQCLYTEKGHLGSPLAPRTRAAEPEKRMKYTAESSSYRYREALRKHAICACMRTAAHAHAASRATLDPYFTM